MEGTDRPLHITVGDSFDEKDGDIAETVHLSISTPSLPSPRSSVRAGSAFLDPDYNDNEKLDLTAFVEQLRTRGARTVSSPSVRAVHFAEEASVASVGTGYADTRE